MKKLPPLEQLPRMPHLQASHDSVRGPPQFYTRDSFPRHFRPPSQGDYLEEIRPQPPFYNVGSGRTSRATLDVPLSSTTSDDDGGGIDACGGHCVAFENFCHYCLQVNLLIISDGLKSSQNQDYLKYHFAALNFFIRRCF